MDNKVSRKMEYVYCTLFWLTFAITIILTIVSILKNELNILKDFSLPLFALIFTVGQLWQNESKNNYERCKYIQERKDLYFDKKVEIVLNMNKYLELLSAEISKPFHEQELLFDRDRFLLLLIDFYRNVVTQAKFLFDEEFVNYIYKMTDIIELISNDITTMVSYKLLADSHRQHIDYDKTKDMYFEHFKELFTVSETFNNKITKILNIEENNNA